MLFHFEVPDHLTICGLEQTAKGWRVYLKLKGTNFLQGEIGKTPQEGVDLTARAIDARQKIWEENNRAYTAAFTELTVDDLDFEL